jgi:hypothetical protein
LEQKVQYNKAMQSIDYDKLDIAGFDLDRSYDLYQRSKGWFSCDNRCQTLKIDFESKQLLFKKLQAEQDRKVSEAKASVGIFSSFGIDETRNLFWTRFNQVRVNAEG